MATLEDQPVRELLEQPNCAVISTFNVDGSVHSVVAWISAEDSQVAINSAVGRRWPSNLERDPRITVLVPEDGNPYNYVEIRGTAAGTREDADDHIDRLSKKYTGEDKFQDRQPGEERVKFVIKPRRIRHQDQS